MKKILVMSSECLNENGLVLQKRVRNYDYPTHIHDFFEIEYIYSGSGEVIINGKSYELKPGTFFFLTPMDLQSMKVSEPVKYLNISFDETWIENDVRNAIVSHNVIYDFVSDFFEMLYAEYSKKDPEILNFRYIKGIFNCILIQMLRSSDSVCSIEANSSYIHKTLQYIHLHFKNPISIEILAKNVNLSPNYLCSVFHKSIGKTVLEYLTDFRLDFSAKLLIHTELPVTQVCYESGFQSYSQFARTFKSKYDRTPKQFRQEGSKSDPTFKAPNYRTELSVYN